MGEPKEQVAAAIARAQADLAEALSELEKVPAFDAGTVAFAAHALNNYLFVITGTVDLIMQHTEGHPDDQLRIWLEGVQHATNLMGGTVTRLMSASATTEAKLRFDKVDLPLLVERACRYYQRLADRKTIRLTVECASDVPPVWTDRVAVAAVLDNLLSNAIKYSQRGRRIEVRVRAEESGAVCGVLDEGPGLSKEDQARLFQRGVRLTPQPTEGELSLGYGLAVAKELIDKLGGAIWCESALGQGSCFLFRLPAYREAASVSPPDATSQEGP